MSVDILIVGAGPTGLLLAAQLARYGIKPRLVDKNPEPSKTSKAIAVFARTLEIFDHLGIAEEAMKRGRKLNQFNFYADRKRIVDLPLDRLDSFLPLVLCLPQSQTEDILGRLVENLGVKIERSVTFTGLKQDADGVTATLCHPDGREEHCRASWLIGCDGARSTVRQEAGLVDEGANIPGLFILADAETNWSLSPNEVHIFLNSDGVFAVFPLPEENYWRVIADLPPDRSLPEDPDLKVFEQLANERSRLETQLTNPLWTSTFRIRQRMVGKCRAGRVFVAGDALSSHSPVGGQGMNTGLQDAYNLAWKLALVIQNQARAELLDSYQAEREPISKSLLAVTGLATRAITVRNPIFTQARDRIAKFATSFESVQQRIRNTVSELNVNYRNSPIVQEDHPFLIHLHPNEPSLRDWWDFRTQPKAGERAPDVMIETVDGAKRLFQVLSDLKHNLLLFGGKVAQKVNCAKLSQIAQQVEEKFRDRIDVHIVLLNSLIPEELEWFKSILLDPQGKCHHRYSATGECLYLIRPDGYIGYRTQPADVSKLWAYLQKINLFESVDEMHSVSLSR